MSSQLHSMLRRFAQETGTSFHYDVYRAQYRLEWRSGPMLRALLVDQLRGQIRVFGHAYHGADTGCYKTTRQLGEFDCATSVTGEVLRQVYDQVNAWTLDDLQYRTY